MLRLLRIRNFAIIDELELEFGPGFNAITGETGAGKSIILDAIGLILGNRANTEVIRGGADEATVEAMFDLGQSEAVARKLESYGLGGPGHDHELLVRRTVHRSGKNKIFLNGELVTLAQLADVCENLVDLCSQHEHQSLAKPAYQLELLDRYGGLLSKRTEIRELFSALRSREAELAVLSGDDGQRARTEDFLRFQLAELEEFNPREGEKEELEAERRRLMNATQLSEGVSLALGLLGGGDSSDGEDVLSLLGRARQRLAKAHEVDPSLKGGAEAMERAALEAEEAVRELSSYADRLESDPARLEEIEARLARWSEIHRKFGATTAEVLAARDLLDRELGDLSHRQERIAEVEKAIAELRATYEKAARELSSKRRNVAKTLRDSVRSELSELLMPETRFEVEFEEGDWGTDGLDRLQLLFSPNAGEEPKPLGKIASGGELSRVMLAIRRTIADRGGIGVYLFDEIDAGIGGQTGSVVGKKLQSVARHNQVICITHLPQVAAFAGAHFSVSKKKSAGRTVSHIALLEGPSRVEELARMLGGLNVTEKSRAHARDLMNQARA